MSNQKRSVTLSYYLRHAPEAANLTMDSEGWVAISQLESNTDFTAAEIFEIVSSDEKGRYSLSPTSLHVRAVQGHSTKAVDLTFKKATPPTVLYHGADARAIEAIKKQGLLPMSRQYVHLSADLKTAVLVGARRRDHLVFDVDAKTMMADGIDFFLSENNVWLVKAVPTKYLKEHK